MPVGFILSSRAVPRRRPQEGMVGIDLPAKVAAVQVIPQADGRRAPPTHALIGEDAEVHAVPRLQVGGPGPGV